MAEREITIGGRRLSQLKVDELKVELEKRGLKKSGNKGVLIERLQEAIDKELEMKEGFESYPVPQQTPAPIAEPWSHRMIQQQQQPGGFPVPPMGIPQGMLNQPQGLLNQPNVMMNQQQMMMRQQQQITSPVQVNEFREQWPQAQMPPPQMLYQQPQQQQQQQQQVLNQIPPMPDTKPFKHSSNHQVLKPAVEPEVESSSSSDNEQDSAQQSSSSSSQESDDHEQERPTSLLNYNYSTESRTETNVSSTGVEDSKSGTVEDDEESSKEAASLQVQEKMEEDVRGPEKRPELEQDENGGDEVKEEKTKPEEREMEVEKEEIKKEAVDEGKDERQNKTVGEEKEEEMLSKSPKTKAVVSPQPEQEASPAEENTFEVEPSEEDKAVVEEPKAPTPPKPASPVVTKKRKLNLPRSALPTTPASEGQPASRKRRWGSSSSSKKTSLSISTDSLKDLIPGVQVHSTPALEAVMDIGGDDNDEEEEEPEEKTKTEQKTEEEKEELPVEKTPEVREEGKRRKDRIVKVEEKKTIKLQRKPVVMETEPEVPKMEVEEEPSEHKPEDNPHPRRTSLPVQEASSPVAADHTPSPARNPRSEMLHVKNLVRPFTLNQLKDLLSKHGTLVEGGFWIDKIKSHCYAVYTDVEEAVASRQALHGVKWPLTSPKILDVDYADEDEMTRDTGGLLGKKKEKEREVKAEKVVTNDHPVVADEKPMEVEEEEEEEQKNAGNLLDNLFRKTKTTPCLYWLPLTDEQIATREREREERRKARQEERDKEEQERKERQEQREKEREIEREKEKRERETEKQRSRSPRNRRRERSKSKSRSRSRGPRRR